MANDDPKTLVSTDWLAAHLKDPDLRLLDATWFFPSEGRDARYAARDDLVAPPLAALAALDDAAFRAKFSGSPIKRIGRDRFVRNVAYAIGNSGDPDLRAAVAPLVADPDPTVADAARWALDRLGGLTTRRSE